MKLITVNKIDMHEMTEIKKALESHNDQRIEDVLSASPDMSTLTDSLRYGIAHFITDVPGTSYTKNSLVWALPILLCTNGNEHMSVDGAMQRVFTEHSRMLVRQLIGPQYEVAAYDGLIHADLLSGLSISDQSEIFKNLFAVGTQEAKCPVFKIKKTVAERVESGLEPEFAMMLGVVSRYNRQPVIAADNEIEILDFKSRMAGTIAMSAKKTFSHASEIICGVPNGLAEAMESGYKMLIDCFSHKFKCSNARVSAIDATSYQLKFDFENADGALKERIIDLKTTLVSHQQISEVWKYAKEKLNSSVIREQNSVPKFGHYTLH